MTTQLTGVRPYWCVAQVLGRVVLERFLSELFLGDVSIFRFFGKIRSETPEITVYGGKS